jgi:putative SOS response-associated peptidase YedK
LRISGSIARLQTLPPKDVRKRIFLTSTKIGIACCKFSCAELPNVLTPIQQAQDAPINARADMATSGMFREAFQRCRCLIPRLSRFLA